jgi:hypothetical protein
MIHNYSTPHLISRSFIHANAIATAVSIAGLDLPAQLHIDQSMILKDLPESSFFVNDSLQVPTKGRGGNVFAAGPAAQFFEPLS